MSEAIRRLRMFAGPNGSGKTSVLREFSREYSTQGMFSLHTYVNADDLLAELASGRAIPLARFGVSLTTEQLHSAMIAGGRVTAAEIERANLRIESGNIKAIAAACDSYLTASMSDCLRDELLASGVSFSFETVMSHPNKVEFLQRALDAGYRTYTYFVATNDPRINIHRVSNRSHQGGHDVPAEKIIERYRRCLELLTSALLHSTRAFLFDNSGARPTLIAEWTPDRVLAPLVPASELPAWYVGWTSKLS